MDAALGLAGGLIMTVSAAYYFLDVLRGRTRPQRSSWAVWAVTGIVGFGTADAGGAGPGAYAAAVDAVACAVTFVISLHPRFGKPGGRRSDPVLVALAVAGVVLWRWGPLSEGEAAVLVVACEGVALWPTLREAWSQPQFESLASWGADLLGSTLCVFAIARPSLAAVVYPAYLVAASAAVATVLLLRRRAAPLAPVAATGPVEAPVAGPAVQLVVFPARELGPYDALRDGGAVVRAQDGMAASLAAAVPTGRTAPAHAGARARPSPPPA